MNYLYFYIHVVEASVFDRVGLESYVVRALEDQDTMIEWFPTDGEEGTEVTGNSTFDPTSEDSDKAASDPDTVWTEGDDLEDAMQLQTQSIEELRSSVTSLSRHVSSMSRRLEDMIREQHQARAQQASGSATAPESKE